MTDVRSVLLEPMTWAEFDAWWPQSVRGSADQQVAAGLLPAPEASARAEFQFAELAPAGLATPLHSFLTVRADDAERPAVGHLWLRVRPLPHEVEAYVFDIDVLPGLRGQGWGGATMREAERFALGLGATVMRLNVFGHNRAALALYTSRGFAVTSTMMHKRIGPAGDEQAASIRPPAVELREMTVREYVDFRTEAQSYLAGNLSTLEALAPAEAGRRAAQDLGRMLPEGPATPGHRLWTAYDGVVPVASVWLQLRDRTDGLHCFGYQLAVRADLRGRGYGREVLAAVESACRQLGATSLGLSVFGSDPAASRVCEKGGFAVTARTMARPL